MPATTHSRDGSIARRGLLAGAMLVANAVAGAEPATAGSTHRASIVTVREDARQPAVAAGPRLVDGAVADVLVQVRGGAVCSGTPVTGTVYVVTAAHCVLDPHGEAAARTVVRDGITYPARAVHVDRRYVDEPKPEHDAAVLELDQVLPGASATIGTALPTAGVVTIAGYQPLDSDGSLLRGRGPHDRPTPKGATGNLIRIASAGAGCTVPAASLSVSARHVEIACGLIPGASGGGMFAEVNGTLVLVGIVSTVALDLSSNGVVPLESLHELLRHPDTYRHDVTGTRPTGEHARIVLS